MEAGLIMTRRKQAALALLALAGATLSAGSARAIVGGSIVQDPEGARRYTVGVMTTNGEICSGVVVAPQLVLTAAHCLVRGQARYVMALDPQFRPREFRAVRSWRNPAFRMSTALIPRNGGDIGMIRLARPLPPDMRPIPIAPSLAVLESSRELRIAGFGVSRFGDRQSAGQLRETSLRLIGYDAGTMLVSERGEIGPSQRSACVGDSGGPVVAGGSRPVLVGIISWVVDLGNGALCQGITAATPLPSPERQITTTLARLGGPQPGAMVPPDPWVRPAPPDDLPYRPMDR